MSLKIRDIQFSNNDYDIRHFFIDHVALKFCNYFKQFWRREHYKMTLFRNFSVQMSLKIRDIGFFKYVLDIKHAFFDHIALEL